MQFCGKRILFLGSSVTYGSAAGGVSFVELMSEACGFDYVKEAVSGTTLADIDETSYVSRLKRVDKAGGFDLFICQLSTNDASTSRSVEPRQTEEAIRYIIGYVKEAFGCPIVFYTGTRFENEKYRKLIELLYSLQKEYGFYIFDLYNDEEMDAVSEEDYKRYMKDPVHPTLEGYREWWTPKFIELCRSLP